jgi:uncharacterized repeat protein (TIGR01451 family)
MKLLFHVVSHLLLSLLIVCAVFSSGIAAETDDTAIFVEAYNAYQQKDYLLVIEKCDQLNQVFPDSPLRDVTLLLTARASLKSGNNDRAAKSVTLFSNEFPGSSLKTSVEEELKELAERKKKGEVLAPDKTLLAAATKVRSERVARARAEELKLEQERVAKAKAEQERLAQIKREEEQREKERLQAEKLAKARIKAAITVNEDIGPFIVGTTAVLPVEIANSGISNEEFLLTVSAAKEYGATLTKAGASAEPVTRLQLAAGETYKGSVLLRMPADIVDGHRSALSIKATSAKFDDVSFQKNTVVVSSAPLVRVVAKLAKQKVAPGEKLRYRLAVLNAGSLAAQNLTIRLQLPPQVAFIAAPDVAFAQEPNGVLIFKVDTVESGRLAEINLDVKVLESSVAGQELRGKIDVINGNLQKKETFSSTASMVVQGQ